MLLAIASAVAAVVGGAALAQAGAGPRVIAPLRAFALAAVIATVLGHLLPEAVAGRGAIVLVAFGAALAAPGVIARLAARGGGHDHALATELAYVSLLLHKLTDGIALGAALAPGQPRHWDVIAAIAAHTVPMAAVVALAYRARPLEAWLRALGLAAAIIAGAALADVAALTVLEGATPWLAAVASGLLLHVVTHDLPAGGDRARADRVLELGALALGAAVPLAFGAEPHGTGAIALAIARACAAPVLLGLLAGALVQALGGRARAGVIGAATLPGCACAAVPRAIELRREGTALGACVGLAIAAPALGLDALLVSIALVGAPVAALRLAASIAIAAIAGAIAGLGPRARGRAESPHDGALLHGGFAHRAATALDELVTHGAPWLCAGLAAAALLAVAGTRLDDLHPLAVVAIALALAVPARVSLVAAMPPAFALVAAGFPAGAAIAALAIAPALSPAVLAFVRREAGAPRALAVVAIALAVAAAVTVAPIDARAPLALPRLVDDVCLALLVALALRSLWRFGAAAWIAALHGHGQHGRTHDETHADHTAPASPHADHHGEHHHH